MYKLDASAFHEAIVILRNTISMVENNPQVAQREMSELNIKGTIEQLTKLNAHVKVLACPITEMAVDDLIGELNRKKWNANTLSNVPSITFDIYGQQAINISKTLERELKLKLVYVLDASRGNFYKADFLFGQEVATKFPSVIHEIDQAGKSYACDLSTASAFHSIRCLEAAARAIARCLGIPDPTKAKDRNWTFLLKEIKDGIDKRWPTASDKLSGEGKTFDEIYGSLGAIQNPYRNTTMHLDAIYTAPDALYVFEMVKGLMKRVASRMDEQGQPLV